MLPKKQVEARSKRGNTNFCHIYFIFLATTATLLVEREPFSGPGAGWHSTGHVYLPKLPPFLPSPIRVASCQLSPNNSWYVLSPKMCHGSGKMLVGPDQNGAIEQGNSYTAVMIMELKTAFQSCLVYQQRISWRTSSANPEVILNSSQGLHLWLLHSIFSPFSRYICYCAPSEWHQYLFCVGLRRNHVSPMSLTSYI